MTQGLTERQMTPKQEAFCLFLFKGLSQREAYLKAGYSGKQGFETVDSHACVLANSAKVLQRLAELRAKADSAAVMDVVERKVRLSEIGRANLTDFTDGENITLKPSAALAELVIDDWRTERAGKETQTSSRTKRLKLRDPIAAIQELNRMERIGTPDSQQSGNLSITITVNYPEGYQPKVIEGEVKKLS